VDRTLTLLGGARLGVDPWPRDRRGGLLLLLAVADGWLERPTILDVLWPDTDEERARHALRQLLVRLRQAAFGPPVEAGGDALRWSVASDLRAFRGALAAGDRAAALAAYGGPLAAGFAIPRSGGFDAWLEPERQRLHDAFRDAALTAAADALGTGDAEGAAALSRRVVDADPLDEDALQAHLRALLAAGRPEAVRRAVERFARGLRDDLGLDVGPATAALAATAEAAVTGSRAAAEVGPLAREAGGGSTLAEGAFPRLDRLGASARRVLEPLALARGPLTADTLAALTALPPHEVADALDEAEAAGLLRDGRPASDELRRAIAERVPAARRRLLHRELAAARGSAGDHADAAEHHLAAGDPGAARQAWLRAASGLVDRGRPDEAARLLDRAHPRLPDGADRAWLLLGLADAERGSGRFDAAGDALMAAERATAHDAAGSGAGDPALALRTALARAALALSEGRVADAARSLEGRAELATLVADDGLSFEMAMLRARVARLRERPTEALALLLPQAERLRRERAGVALAQVLTSVGVLYGDLGDHELARAHALEALEVCRALRARYLQVDVALNLLFHLAELRRFDEIDALAAETLALGEVDNLTVFRSNLAALYVEAGRPADALAQDRALLAGPAPAHVHAIAAARSAGALAALGEAGAVGAQLDAALAALTETDHPVARGWVAIAVLRHGDDARLRRALELVPGLSEDDVAPHQRAAFREAWAARNPDAPAVLPARDDDAARDGRVTGSPAP